MSPRSRRERELYRYRPDDMAAQRDAAARLKAHREQKLQGISSEWESSLRERLPGVEPGAPAQRRVLERRPKKRAFWLALTAGFGALVRRGTRGRHRTGGRRHARRRS